LLLDKDFDHRDALDLITQFHIEDFLETSFAENVVQEIWRSRYGPKDLPLTASTNHMLLWEYWHFMRDVEDDQPWLNFRDVNTIENHPFQFTVWRYSPKSRTFIEFLVTLGFAILMHWLMTRIWIARTFMETQGTILLDMDRATQAIQD